jgi:hypothetical protein
VREGGVKIDKKNLYQTWAIFEFCDDSNGCSCSTHGLFVTDRHMDRNKERKKARKEASKREREMVYISSF